MRGTLRWVRADLRARRGQALLTVGVVAGVPTLETLVVGGPNFTDTHLSRLRHLRTLGLLVLDSTAVNDAAVDLYGYSRDQFLEMRVTDLRWPAESARLALAMQRTEAQDLGDLVSIR